MFLGNSRGEYHIERDEGYEDRLQELFTALGYDSWQDMDDFENDTFSVMPYWWGGCTCGWDDIGDGHTKEDGLKHRQGCFTVWYRKHRPTTPDNVLYNAEFRWRETEMKEEYQRRGWDTDAEDWWFGCAIRCDCDYGERFDAIQDEYAKEFGHKGHKPECRLVRPNFFYKPTGYALQWYKYPLRDSYANQDVTLEEFGEIITKCIESLQGLGL